MPGSVIVGGARTPMGKLLGGLRDFSGTDLGAVAVRAALERAGITGDQVDYVVLGQVLQAGAGQMPARQAAVKAGIPLSVPSLLVNKVCLSGLDAIALADQLIGAGEFEVVVAGGMESMTNAPHLLPGLRKGHKYGAVEMLDSMAYDGLVDAFDHIPMGESTDRYSERLGITRAEQDEFAVRSQNLAEQAIKDGFYAREISPVTLPNGTVVDTDDGPRPGVTLEALSQLKPVFGPNGTVTAGNCCPLNDGAAALVVMSERKARELGIDPLARVVATGLCALSPEIMGLGPVQASRRALANAGMTIDDVDLVEINEAFAAQVIPSYRDLGIDLDRLNVHGGAIALGHPFGMTGARITCTLLNSLARRDKTVGLATMCVGGGQGMAMILERLS